MMIAMTTPPGRVVIVSSRAVTSPIREQAFIANVPAKNCNNGTIWSQPVTIPPVEDAH